MTHLYKQENHPRPQVPSRRLYTGVRLPAIGIGTFGSDHAPAAQIAQAVADALAIGYRLIDCAACYGNEPEIGAVLRAGIDGGIARDDLFVLSKLWNDCHHPADVIRACKQSLVDLEVDVLDAYLVHWPFPNAHDPNCDQGARNPHARPYIHEAFMETWRAMETLVDEGWVRHIGTSNMTIAKLERLRRDARIQPAINEMELHPSFQQGELYQYLLDHAIVPIGYCPIGSPARPARDRTPHDLVDIEMPALVEIARARQLHPATLCVKWAAQRGQIPIPMSTNPKHLRANLDAVCQDPLSIEEMHTLRGLERNNRLIKGQVFLWPGAKSWLDLWDLDGTIPGWDGYIEKGCAP